MPMSSDGFAANTSGWSIGPRARETGLIGCAERIQHSCPLATKPRQRQNIGSRMKREVHVRFWERPRVKVPRATRQKPHLGKVRFLVRCRRIVDLTNIV